MNEALNILNVFRYYPLIGFSVWMPLLPFSIGLVGYSKLTQEQKWLTLLMGIALIVQVLGLHLSLSQIGNQLLFHLYTPIEFIILSLIFQKWLAGWWDKRVFYGLGVGFVGFAIANAIWLQPAESQTNTYAILLASVCMIVFAISFFYRVISEMSLGPLEQSPAFWINASVLLYYAGSILILGLDNYLEGSLLESVWVFHSSFNILHYLLFAIGLWIKAR